MPKFSSVHTHMALATLSLVLPPSSLPPNFRVFQTSKPGTHQSLTLFPFIVKSHLLFPSTPATMCSPFMYISPYPVFHSHLVYPLLHTLCITITPNLAPIAPLFSPTNAIPADLYIRLPFMYVFNISNINLRKHCPLFPTSEP